MQILYGPDFNINCETVVTIGKFDGLHSGHLRVIDKLLEVSKEFGLSSVIYTFNLNPRLVLNNDRFVPLMSNKEKSDKIASLGVDYLIYEDFNMEFILCYTDKEGKDIWESILGEDAMNVRVGELVEELNCEDEDIMVFDRETEW